MEQLQDNASVNTATNREDISIFDELKPLPVYYSEKAVRAFAILFGVLFGSVLIAMNFNNTTGKKGISQVLAFGILFTAIQIWVLNMIPKTNSGLTFVINLGGAAVLQKYFWEKFIGKDVAYTKRSVLVPGIVGVILVALILVAMLANY